MLYETGEVIEVGDAVTIEHGRTPGTVRTIIDTQQLMDEWNVSEPGTLIEAEPFGLVFWPQSDTASPLRLTRKGHVQPSPPW
jgi:hypothetical protein